MLIVTVDQQIIDAARGIRNRFPAAWLGSDHAHHVSPEGLLIRAAACGLVEGIAVGPDVIAYKRFDSQHWKFQPLPTEVVEGMDRYFRDRAVPYSFTLGGIFMTHFRATIRIVGVDVRDLDVVEENLEHKYGARHLFNRADV